MEFLLGVVVGGGLVFIGFILISYSAKSTVKEDDPADWWKNGKEKEKEIDEEFPYLSLDCFCASLNPNLEDDLKETLRNKLAKSGSKPYSENYNADHTHYGSITITQKDKQHLLVWELVDRSSGRMIDSIKKEYASFDDMWLDILVILIEKGFRD